nr:MAG TPA: hypothetical protein [Caudoviricetes sp.]
MKRNITFYPEAEREGRRGAGNARGILGSADI